MPRPCQHLSDKGESKISVRFSSHHMKIKGCNCWQWPGPTGGKRPLLSTSMCDSWPCSYWPSYLHYQHAPCDSYNPLQLPALSRSRVHRDNCLLWVDCECLTGKFVFIISNKSHIFHSLSSVVSTPFLLLSVKYRERSMWQYLARAIVCP